MAQNGKNKEYYLNLNYSMIINKEDDEFVAYYKEYPKVTGCGDNEIEAIEDLKEAFSCLLDVLIAEGEEIREPAPVEKKIRVNVIRYFLLQHTNIFVCFCIAMNFLLMKMFVFNIIGF